MELITGLIPGCRPAVTSFMHSLVMSKESSLIFFTRPISIAFIVLTAVSVVSGTLLRSKARSQQVELEESDS